MTFGITCFFLHTHTHTKADLQNCVLFSSDVLVVVDSPGFLEEGVPAIVLRDMEK
jgi:hypothetical protein